MIQLPPIPAADRIMWQYGKQIDHYSLDQLRADRLAVIEAVAAWLDGQRKHIPAHGYEFAAALRDLKEQVK